MLQLQAMLDKQYCKLVIKETKLVKWMAAAGKRFQTFDVFK